MLDQRLQCKISAIGYTSFILVRFPGESFPPYQHSTKTVTSRLPLPFACPAPRPASLFVPAVCFLARPWSLPHSKFRGTPGCQPWSRPARSSPAPLPTTSTRTSPGRSDTACCATLRRSVRESTACAVLSPLRCPEVVGAPSRPRPRRGSHRPHTPVT